MNKKLVSVLQYLLVFGLGIFLIWWQLRSLNTEQKAAFASSLEDANFWLVIPIVFMALASHLSRALRWKLLMEPLGFHPKTSNTFFTILIGYLANTAIPRLGEVLKCTFLARYEKLPIDKLVGTMVVERVFDMVCYFLFILITVAMQVEVVGDFIWQMVKPVFSGSGSSVFLKLGIVFLLLILIYAFLRFLFRTFPHNRIVKKLQLFYSHLWEGLISIKNLKRRRDFILHTLFIWAMYLLQIYLGFFAMEGTSNLGIRAAFSVLTLVTLAMILTPGGIGSFPVFVAKTLGIYAIASPVGIAFGWLMWGITTGIILVFGSLCLFLIPIINKPPKHESVIEHSGQNIHPGGAAKEN